MMKNIILISAFFLLISFISLGNNDSIKQHNISAQFNPYINGAFFDNFLITKIFALRYGYSFNNHIQAGVEFSGYKGKGNEKLFIYVNDYINWSQFNYGCFIRYSVFKNKKINPFIELSTYYSSIRENARLQNNERNIKENYISGYIAPGLSLSLFKKRVFLDTFYKFSNKVFSNGHKSVITYRLRVTL